MQIASIITPDMSRREARAALKKAGWEFVGGGSFATTYASPDGTVVAKVTKPDAGQSAVYRIAKANPDNPHFPRFAGRIRLGQRGYVYEVERLDEWDDYDHYSDAEAATDLHSAWELIRDAINASRDGRHKPLDDDTGFRNSMHRDGVFVFTDPLYSEPDLSRAYRGRGTSNPDHSGYGQDPDNTQLAA